jgi:sulfate transport system permease protein
MTDYALNIRTNHPLAESRPVRLTLIGTALFYIGVMIFLPLIVVFIEALRQGMGAYIDAITEPDAQAAIKLTLLTASIAVPLNLVFGLAGELGHRQA